MKLEKALVGATSVSRTPACRHCNRWPDANYRTNTPTNTPTNKHDGSQYLLAEVIRLIIQNTKHRNVKYLVTHQSSKKLNQRCGEVAI